MRVIKHLWFGGYKGQLLVVFGLMGVICLCLTIGVILFSTPDPGRNAFYAAQNYVEKNLKAPATARFSSLADKETGYKTVASRRYEAWGYVDSENTFGAMLRNKWRVVLQENGEDYQVLYASIGDQLLIDIVPRYDDDTDD